MKGEFQQLVWDEALQADWDALLRLAVREDLAEAGDLTTSALVPPEAPGSAILVARRPGVVAGLPAAEMTLRRIDPRVRWEPDRKTANRSSLASGSPGSLVRPPVCWPPNG